MSHLSFYHNLLIGLHIIAVIAWMAGLLYLPRLFAYHTAAAVGSELDETFKTMEVKLLRIIMNPAMVAVWTLGLTLIWFDSTQLKWGWGFLATPWMLAKLAGVLLLTAWHHYLGLARKALAAGRRERSPRFWRMTNELPFLAAIVMVLAITTKFAF
jgi:putative membrane protein